MSNYNLQTPDSQHKLNKLFDYYPAELVEAALLPLLAKETDYWPNEPMNITHVFYAELNEIIQQSLMAHKQLEEAEEEVKKLSRLVSILTGLIPVAYIFCKNIKHPNASFTIVLKKDQYKPFDEIKLAVNFALTVYPKINCLVHAYGTIADLVKHGNLYYSHVCEPKYCIYHADRIFSFTTTDKAIQQSGIKNEIIFWQQYDKANSFLNAAQDFREKRQAAMAIFMLQQACEFSYRSLIFAFRGTAMKSHDLLVLHKYVSIYEPRILGLFYPKLKKELKLLAVLNEAYVKARYDFTYEIDEKDLSLLSTCTQGLVMKVKEVFEDYL